MFFKFATMMMQQQLGSQALDRRPEPSELTDQIENVAQYDQVMTTKLVLAYAAGLQIIHRARAESAQGKVVDLACGPGHFTLCLSRFLGFESVRGVDLSPPMVEFASANARKFDQAHRVDFEVGDVTRLERFETDSVDLTTFTDAAHHLPDLKCVASVVEEMDRITRPEGLVMIMDLARLRTDKLTEEYVSVLGCDYVERGLPAFLEDFRNSMYAAWTVHELRETIPGQSRRRWCHLVPRGLPTTQVILGLPEGRRKVFVRSGTPWEKEESPVPREMQGEWRLLSATLGMASRKIFDQRIDRR